MTDTPHRLEQPARMSGPVLVGVVQGQRPVVVEQAAKLAAAAGLPLVCAHVDVTVYPVDGTTGGAAAPIDPDSGDADVQDIPEQLRKDLEARLSGLDVEWSAVFLAGEPAKALAREANHSGASMIVVGSRDHKLGSVIKELTGGSIARHLVHHQDRPVLVVPVDPRLPDDDDED
ncbi:universal stress protein [Paenarthrobacter sp. NyZ202]|uniref:universal stress protein n=1 Tax=Paenarthrobacter sp. NyZ202 TaxID=3402689 RepID=UPI003CEF5C8F